MNQYSHDFRILDGNVKLLIFLHGFGFSPKSFIQSSKVPKFIVRVQNQLGSKLVDDDDVESHTGKNVHKKLVQIDKGVTLGYVWIFKMKWSRTMWSRMEWSKVERNGTNFHSNIMWWSGMKLPFLCLGSERNGTCYIIFLFPCYPSSKNLTM